MNLKDRNRITSLAQFEQSQPELDMNKISECCITGHQTVHFVRSNSPL